MNKYLVLYHEEDNDGVFSCAIIYNYLIEELKIDKSNIVLEGTTYNKLKETYPTINEIIELNKTFTNVIMVDISFNDYKQLKGLYNIFGSNFLWIDHHKPIINLSFKYKFDECSGYRDTRQSAILNTYKYLYDPLDINRKNDDIPLLFKILSAYDSWSWKQEKLKFDKCRNVNKAITIEYNLDINKVIPLVHDLLYSYDEYKEIKLIRKMNKIGKQVNSYDDILNKNQLENYGDYEWTVNGEKSVMIMFQGPTSSLMFNSLKNTEYKHGIVLKYLPSGIYNVSLYNINTKDDKRFHCGEYLNKKYKGGGHAGAAGAVLSNKMFLKIIKSKEL